MKDLVIFGAGSVGRLVCEIAKDVNLDTNVWNLLGFLDENNELHGTNLNSFPILGTIEWLGRYRETTVVVAIAEPIARRRLVLDINCMGNTFATLVHPFTWIASRVSIGVGTIVYPGVLVDPDVRVCDHVILNKACTIGHDTVIKDLVTVSPGVNIGGMMTIGEGCFFGINSATNQGLSIGHWSTIGSGAVVVKNLPPNVTAVGVPAKPIQQRPEGWHKR